jgi:uncharacterized membrane protein
MFDRARGTGLGVHSVLVVLPLGFFAGCVALDAVTLAFAAPTLAPVAAWDALAGLVTALVAGALGVIELLRVPVGSRAFRAGVAHAVAAVFVLQAFGASLALRWPVRPSLPGNGAIVSALAGLAVAVGSAWLGNALGRRAS